MVIDRKNIYTAISHDSELCRMLSLVKDIAIMEYDGMNIDGCCAIAHYMEDNDFDTSSVKRIILLGKRGITTNINKEQLSKLFPNAIITIVNKFWQEVSPKALKVVNCLVFHSCSSVGITDYMFNQKIGKGEQLHHIIKNTRSAYFACITREEQASFFEHSYVIKSQLHLTSFELFKDKTEQPPQTRFCREKQEYLTDATKYLIPKDVFFQCIDEAEHGCIECNQCDHYGTLKKCPFAQHAVARHYRNGVFVPKNEIIAHQWDVMAARQGFNIASIQVADDLKDGCGCKKDVNKAIEIYSFFASKTKNEHSIHQILKIADEDPDINPLIAIPFIAQQALEGNEEMIIKLSEAFQYGTYGLPKDTEQQKEWNLRGAEKGIPYLTLALAKLCEERREWSDAYNWYKTLYKVAPDLQNAEKLEEIELMMLTDGATPEEIAIKGENYLYGYFGTERDLHLAYRCLKYASSNGVSSATGLLGIMSLEGLGVDKDFAHAVLLLTQAAEDDDLLSMDKLTDFHLAGTHEYNDGERWQNIIVEKIEAGICDNKPLAYYLKGHYQSLGHLYQNDDRAAFDNMLKAAELGYPKAQYEVSEMYSLGTGTELDSEKANMWLKTSAENGYYEAKGKYGIRLYNSVFWWENRLEQSFTFLKHAFEQGFESAYWYLAQCYMNGYGTAVNKELAYPLYQRAAEEGIREAQEFLCEKYFKGDTPLPKDYKLCAKWGEAAIKQGCKNIRFKTAYSQSHMGNHIRAKEIYLELANEGDAAAMNNYACELSDPKEEAEWFLKAANKGDDYGMWNIGRRYRDGTGVEQDSDLAIKFLTLSANKGHSGAMLDLAEMYRYGNCVEKNGKKAIEWYEKAANDDKTEAILALAEIYSEGELVPKDSEKVVYYYKMAAEKNNSTALYKLGQVYEKGNCVEKNIHKAIFWYRKAAKKGSVYAKRSLVRLKSNWLDTDGNIVDELNDYEAPF